MKRTSRMPCKLSDSLHHRLNAYALAAGAAGVSLLAPADPAQAKIVYTPAGVTFGGGPHPKPFFNGQHYLDLNHDGIPDFVFEWSTFSSFRSVWLSLRVRPIGFDNGVAGMSHVNHGSGGSYNKASCLGSGASIGPQQRFAGSLMASSFWPDWSNGSWFNSEGYLGLRFTIHGLTHYGWARVNVLTNTAAVAASLLGYAYETIPNKPIILSKEQGPCQRRKSGKENKHANPASLSTVEPGSLGHLAQGASGIAAWRRKEQPGRITK